MTMLVREAYCPNLVKDHGDLGKVGKIKKSKFGLDPPDPTDGKSMEARASVEDEH